MTAGACAAIGWAGTLVAILLILVAIAAPVLFVAGGKYADAISAETGDRRRRVVDWKRMTTRGALGPGGERFRLTVLGLFVFMAGALVFAVLAFGLVDPLFCRA
jgi:hypothetical protein